MIRNNEYVPCSFLTGILDASETTIRTLIQRAEFDKYRKMQNKKLYILNCKEVRNLLKDFLPKKNKIEFNDYITDKQYATILNCSHTTISMYKARPEFASYRLGNKLKFCRETKQLFINLIRPKFCKGERLDGF